jgi:hypothetical protein
MNASLIGFEREKANDNEANPTSRIKRSWGNVHVTGIFEANVKAMAAPV